jgi:Flp pilus assembly protein TadD
MAGEFKKATECLEKAVALNPNDSNAYHWLGRAWGRRAETSSWFTAIQYARKTRDAFEKAVDLNPANAEAVNDLFEYYLEAPGFLGGGLDKASKLIERIRALDPVEYHYAQARLAEKRKEYAQAEEQLRRAVELAPRQAGRIVDLAKFLAKQGRFQESDAVFEQARTLAPESPKVLFEEAQTYVKSRRNLALAQELLKRYLEAPLSPGDPPRSEALKLLRQAQGG